MEYKVVTEGNENEVWACGFYGEFGRQKAQERIDSGYWHRFMYDKDKHKKLLVVKVQRSKNLESREG